MALNAGSENAETGMSLEIYEKLDIYLSPPLQEAVDEAKEAVDKAKLEEKEGKEKAVAAAQEALDKARLGWKKLAYSIAYGVIEHIKSNMEIKDITAKGDVSITISGSTGVEAPVLTDPTKHTHSIALSDTDSNVVFTQNNDGTGHVQ